VSALLGEIAGGRLRVPIAHTYTLDQAPQAIADFGEHKQGKLVITTR
jgi:NADPH:quinone reductase-like Zn-dependent oxidoreductase